MNRSVSTKAALSLDEISAIFQRSRGAKAQIARELEVPPQTITLWLRGGFVSERIGAAMQMRAAKLKNTERTQGALQYRDAGGSIRYVTAGKATAEHHERHIAFLREAISVAARRLEEAETMYARLQPVFCGRPGLTTEEALALLGGEGQAA